MMKIRFLQQVAVVLAAAICSVAVADYTGEDWTDPDFLTHKVKKISLSVKGKWKGSKAQVDERDVTEALTRALERKGYEVIADPEAPADATLTVSYVSLSGGRSRNTVSGTALLKLSEGGKVVFRAKGEAQGTRNVQVGHSFCQIIDKLPPLPGQKPQRPQKPRKRRRGR